jgi:hypothetical protein
MDAALAKTIVEDFFKNGAPPAAQQQQAAVTPGKETQPHSSADSNKGGTEAKVLFSRTSGPHEVLLKRTFLLLILVLLHDLVLVLIVLLHGVFISIHLYKYSLEGGPLPIIY